MAAYLGVEAKAPIYVVECGLKARRELVCSRPRAERMFTDINELWESIRCELPQFHNSDQQDAHEFILAVLQRPLPDRALEAFTWQAKVTLTLPATGYHSTVTETHILMQLNIHQACTSLEHCISAAHQEEQLAHTESLFCPFTLEYETTFRTTAIERLPLKLLIQLKRFTQHGKNNTAAKIPRLISLRSTTQGIMTYGITAAVIHHGGLQQGHYTAVIFKEKPATIMYCDDSTIRNISWATADHLLQQAYILAYAQLP